MVLNTRDLQTDKHELTAHVSQPAPAETHPEMSNVLLKILALAPSTQSPLVPSEDRIKTYHGGLSMRLHTIPTFEVLV